MKGRSTSRISAALSFVIAVAGAGAAGSQDKDPGQLHTIRKAGTHRVRSGDLLQVRYKTHSSAEGIGNLDVAVSGDSVRRVGVVTADIDPERPGVPGAPYFVIAFLKAERRGTSTIQITPVTNVGNRQRTFAFKAEVEAEP
jgi:hypothetical protein